MGLFGFVTEKKEWLLTDRDKRPYVPPFTGVGWRGRKYGGGKVSRWSQSVLAKFPDLYPILTKSNPVHRWNWLVHTGPYSPPSCPYKLTRGSEDLCSPRSGKDLVPKSLPSSVFQKTYTKQVTVHWSFTLWFRLSKDTKKVKRDKVPIFYFQ